jgi:hypothetical protein
VVVEDLQVGLWIHLLVMVVPPAYYLTKMDKGCRHMISMVEQGEAVVLLDGTEDVDDTLILDEGAVEDVDEVGIK